jgi:hypothetical protein
MNIKLDLSGKLTTRTDACMNKNLKGQIKPTLVDS